MSLVDPFLFPGERAIIPTRTPFTTNPRREFADPGGVIYGLGCRCHPEAGIQYVGLTKRSNPLTRFREHLRVAEAGANIWQSVYEWIPEHGADNITFEVIESGIPDDQLRYRELCHIRGLRGAGNRLMNQDDFWWVDQFGVWQHTWPDWHPFDRIDCVSFAFVSVEFDRGIYPLTYGEYQALFPGVERQSVDGLAEFLTKEGRELARQWRQGLPDLDKVRNEPVEYGSENHEVLYFWAKRVRQDFEFPPPKRFETPGAPIDQNG